MDVRDRWFGDHFFEHKDFLVNFFRKRGCGDDSQDLAQETFLKAYQKFDDLRNPASFKFWLLKIAKHTFLNQNRKQVVKGRKIRPVSLSSFAGFVDRGTPPVLKDTSKTPLKLLLEEEDLARLEEAFKQLPEQMRLCICLRIHQNLKYKEIAEVMQLEINTIKSHLFQAKEKLKELLGEYEADLGVEE